MEQSKVDLLNALSPNQLGETIAVAQPDTALLIRLWERLDAEGLAALEPDLAGRVRFLGHADPAEVFPRWDLIVSASTSPEAGPLGVLEAMAAGVPVLGTGHGGTAEYLAGGSGRLVPPGDVDALAEAMRELIHDPDGRARLRDRARQVAERDHDLTTTLPRMLEALTRA